LQTETHIITINPPLLPIANLVESVKLTQTDRHYLHHKQKTKRRRRRRRRRRR
jgi:hypothetical protein